MALARKIAGILFAIWRDDARYDPTRGAERVDDADKSEELLAAIRSDAVDEQELA